MNRVLVILAALAFAAAASAQAYKWVDKDGKVRYGDTPPPGVKATPLKLPSGPKPPPPPPSADAAKKDAPAKKDEKPLTPEQAFQKRQKERQEADEKAQKERAAAEENRQQCEIAQANLRTVQSGQRMSTTNAAGERIFMDDEARERALQNAQKAVSEWCK
jgi:hypothetical protein